MRVLKYCGVIGYFFVFIIVIGVHYIKFVGCAEYNEAHHDDFLRYIVVRFAMLSTPYLLSKNCRDAIFSAICTGMCVARLKHKRIQIEGSPT